MDLLGWIRTASKNERDGPIAIATSLCVARPMLSITIFKSHPQLIFSGCHQVQAILGEFSVKSTSINTAQPGLVKKHHFQSIKNDAHWGPPSAAVGATPCSRVFHMVPCAMQAAASEVGLLKKLAVYGTTMIARYHCRLNIRLIYVCNIIYIYIIHIRYSIDYSSFWCATFISM